LVYNIGPERIIVVFYTIPIQYLLLSFSLIIPIILITNYQWQLLLKKQKILIGFFDSLKILLIGNFYASVTPGGFGGYIKAYYISKKKEEPVEKCLANLLIFETMNFFGLLCLAIVGAVIVLKYYPNFLILIGTLFIIAILVIFILAEKHRSEKIFKSLVRILIYNKIKERLSVSLDLFYQDFPRIKDLITPFFVFIIGWVIYCSEIYLVFRLFLIDIPFLYFIFLYPVVMVIASLPISISGIGTREGALIVLFSIFNVSPEKLVALGLFWMFIIQIIPATIGGFLVIKERIK